jgi:DNA repair exonuclease SbcCD ATPase subunit
MTKERAQSASASQVADLAARVAFLGQRLEALSTTVSTTAAGAAADPSVKQRVAMLEVELASLKAQAEQRSAEPDRPSDELNTMLATLRSQVEALGDLRSGVSEEQLDERVAETDGALTQLSGRLDALAESVESAAAGLGDEEHELVALHRHFTESSARIESIVEDIREALSAFPEPGSSTADELVARVERIEKATREAADGRERSTGELARRIDVIDQRVATVATEVARTKTLWPVALRSLEARLDDVSHVRRPEASADDEGAQLTTEAPADDSDDLLAGLRDSLHAMETVAAEMARASDALTPPEAEGDGSDALDAPVAAAGATIVPLRTGEL